MVYKTMTKFDNYDKCPIFDNKSGLIGNLPTMLLGLSVVLMFIVVQIVLNEFEVFCNQFLFLTI